MKRIIVLLVLTLNWGYLLSQTLYPSGVGGCISRWTFDLDESFYTQILDQSGNNNHGSNNTIGSVKGFNSITKQAGDFNGVSSFSEVMHTSILNPTNITTIALVKFDSFYNGNCQGNNIIYKGFNYNADLNWAMFIGETDNDCSMMNPSNEKLAFFSPNTIYTPPPNNFIQTNKWYFLATSFDGVTIKHYQIEMDSLNKATNILPNYIINSSLPLGNGTYNIFIGKTQNPPYPFYINGAVDELIIFNKALTDNEMQSVYDFLFGPSAPSTNEGLFSNEAKIYSLNKKIYIKSVEDFGHVVITNYYGQKLINESFSKNAVFDLTNSADNFIIVTLISNKKAVVSKKVILR